MVKQATMAAVWGFMLAGAAPGQNATMDGDGGNRLVLWYHAPAADWNGSLPLGNGGKICGRVFGGVPKERIQLNETSVWSGKPHDYAHPGAYKYLGQIRQILQDMRRAQIAGDLKKAKELQGQAEELSTQEFMSIPVNQTSYQPMAELYIDFPDHGQFEDYRRELDLKTGLQAVTYTSKGVHYTRQHFGSYPDKCVVTRISADKPGAISCSISLEGEPFGQKNPNIEYKVKSIAKDGIVLWGHVLAGSVKTDKTIRDGVIEFEVHLLVDATGGQVSVEGDHLNVRGASDVTLKLVAASNYTDYKTVDGDPNKRCLAMLKPIAAKSYEDLYRAYEADYQALFGRVSLSLGDPNACKMPTDERVANYVKTQDYDLLTLMFQFDRYMAIVGSREGGLPFNLLGGWALKPAWGCRYTCNINIEMNYWAMNKTALPECNIPLFEMLKQVAESGSRTAREHYNADGWVLHHNWDLWCGTAPIDKPHTGIWQGGSGWMTLHLWEQFLYTGDMDFLKEYYPMMKGAVLFYSEVLYKDEITGYLISGPSNSPEHGGLAMGPMMDQQIIRSLFKAYVLASRLVGDDSDLPKKVAGMIGRIAPNKIGQYGQLQEWLEDLDKPKDVYRHLSHLWAVFPGDDITWKNPELMDAARVSLIARGDGQTGFSMAWKLNLWARLLDGRNILHVLDTYVLVPGTGDKKGSGYYPNLTSANDPFVLDGNFGFCSGLAELLMQSHIMADVPQSGPLYYSDFNFMIHLLPALPPTWDRGSFEGMRARGGFEIGCTWERGKLKTATIKSLNGNPCQVRYGDKVIDLKLAKGETKQLAF